MTPLQHHPTTGEARIIIIVLYVYIYIYYNICDVCTALYKLLSRVRDENNRRPDVSVYTYA